MGTLNARQLEAVTAGNGPVLVLAGAGSGKTRVLTERIAYLIRERGVSPERILAFTFTNKAAGEMRSRVEKLLGARELPLWIGTFHATGLRILRREAHHLGVGRDFSVYDEDDAIALVKQVTKELGFALDEFPPAVVLERISRWKCDLVLPEQASNEASDGTKKEFVRIYERYQAGLRKANAMDFDDLIARVVELFTAHPHVRDRYARQFLHVLVDEFQDTSAIQMLMIDFLAGRHRNLFVVGDDDQAIYGWRGATVENILQFDRLYSGAAIIRLEENYRSTNAILEAANQLISRNRGRLGKNLWSRLGAGEKPVLVLADDDEEEASAIRDTVLELIRAGYRRSDIAILYRTHAQSRVIETLLRTTGLPYQIIGGVRFYERREIRDLLGYLKVVANPGDNVNFARIVNVPRRGIGEATLRRIAEAAGEGSFLAAARNKAFLSTLQRSQRDRVASFLELISSIEREAISGTAYDVLSAVIEKTRYRDYLREDPKTVETRIENVEELLVEAQRFSASSRDPSLRAFLEEIALLSDIDTMEDDDSVALMTLHNAKGLEYRAVLIAGIEEGLLPHYSSFDDEEDVEEERRLFYVGITRAKERLFLFAAANRMRFGSFTAMRPSRFLADIPSSLLQIEDGCNRRKLEYRASRVEEFEHDRHKIRKKEKRDFPAESVATSLARRLKKGARVIHPTYGEGVVRSTEGSGEDMRVSVYFPSHGEKKFLAAYAPFRFE